MNDYWPKGLTGIPNPKKTLPIPQRWAEELVLVKPNPEWDLGFLTRQQVIQALTLQKSGPVIFKEGGNAIS